MNKHTVEEMERITARRPAYLRVEPQQYNELVSMLRQLLDEKDAAGKKISLTPEDIKRCIISLRYVVDLSTGKKEINDLRVKMENELLRLKEINPND